MQAESQDVHSGSGQPKIAVSLACQQRSTGFATVTATASARWRLSAPQWMWLDCDTSEEGDDACVSVIVRLVASPFLCS